ncbi:MAG: hypothetical protein ACR2PF_01040 [Rhizobiaceae bacterium]
MERDIEIPISDWRAWTNMILDALETQEFKKQTLEQDYCWAALNPSDMTKESRLGAGQLSDDLKEETASYLSVDESGNDLSHSDAIGHLAGIMNYLAFRNGSLLPVSQLESRSEGGENQ